jgi:hypothetical protein
VADESNGNQSEGLTSRSAVNLRFHRVDLERVQRIHCGLDSEPMEFTAATIAEMLGEIAARCDEEDAFSLHAIVNALLGNDDHHELILRQRKRGKFVSPDKSETKRNRQQLWLHWLAGLERRGAKTESAVAEIAADQKVSRATIFAGVRAAEDFLETGRMIFPDSANFANPRPVKDGKA